MEPVRAERSELRSSPLDADGRRGYRRPRARANDDFECVDLWARYRMICRWRSTFHIAMAATPRTPRSRFEALLDEVEEDPLDHERVGMGVVHESGWAIEVHSGWAVTFENVEDLDVEPRHIIVGRDRERVLRLMRAAAEGDLAALESEPWQPGYGGVWR